MSKAMATATTEAAPLTEQAPKPEVRLTVADRCDTCGAQAYVAAEVNGTELLYCSHHGTKYEERLRATSTQFHDERFRLLDS